MGFKMSGWTGNHGSSFKKGGKTSAEIRKEKFDAKNLDNLKKGKYGRDLYNAIQYDKYTSSANMYDPSGKYKKKKLSQKLEYGTVKSEPSIKHHDPKHDYTIPESGQFVRHFTIQGEKGQRNRRSSQAESGHLGKPIMTSWNDPNPVVYNEKAGEYYTKDRNPHEWGDTKKEGLKNIKNIGTLPGEGFTDSQIRRVKGAWRRSKVGGPTQHGTLTGGYSKSIKKRLTGRAKVKGETHKFLETGGKGGQSTDKKKANYYKPYIESYMEGENITKTTRRQSGSLNMQRDKVKRKKEGFVRKTGEGFLGLQNRKKYIDGVEVVKTKKTRKPKSNATVTNTVNTDNIKTDMPEVVVTPKMQNKRERKANRVARRNKRKENLARLKQDVKNYREKNYGI